MCRLPDGRSRKKDCRLGPPRPKSRRCTNLYGNVETGSFDAYEHLATRNPAALNPATDIPMKSSITTIGAITVLIASFFTAQADEHRGHGLSQEEFERAAAVLKKGAAAGKISEEAARAGIEGMRAAVKKTDQKPEATKPMNRENAGKMAAEIRKAVAEGKMSEEDARKKLEQLRRSMAAQGQRDGQRNPRERFARAEAELKKAVEEGKMTPEQARERLQKMRKSMAEQGQREGQRNPREVYAKTKAELMKAVEAGEITEEQAKERLEGLRKRLTAQNPQGEPRGRGQNPREMMARAEAELKKAVESGRITEEQARERLQAMRRKMGARSERSAREEYALSLIHISEPTRLVHSSRMPASA